MQLKLKDHELERLGRRIEQNVRDAKNDHDYRMARFRKYMQRWRILAEAPTVGNADRSRFRMPMTQWHTMGRLAQVLQRIFGEDAEIQCSPVGPSDYRKVEKVARYMNWRLFQSMKVVNPMTVFFFRTILFGRAHAYRPWVKDQYDTLDGRETWYEGPGFFPQAPGDLIFPAEQVDSLQQFSNMTRRLTLTPQELLDGEADQRYFGITESFPDILKHANATRGLEEEITDDLREDEKLAEGVDSEGESSRGKLLVYEWYGGHRLPKGKKDSEFDDLKSRDMRESELVVRYIPALNKVIGAESLMELYPRMKNRRPFCEASLVKDGSYWGPGFGELLESIEDEASANHQLFTDVVRFSAGPLIIYRPGSGFDPNKFKYEPFSTLPSEDPAGINIVQPKGDLNGSIAQGQTLRGIGELATGVSDSQLGRAASQPNAPRTASGQIALLEKGDIRAELDILGLREDLRTIIGDLWQLDCDMAGEQVFFRVTEDDAMGIMEDRAGFGKMTAQERAGRFDFDIKFATALYNREQRKQNLLSTYQLLVTTNPLIAQDGRMLMTFAKKICKAMDLDDLASMIPIPPEIDKPREPKEEWTLILQGEGELVRVNPADDDEGHIKSHMKMLEEAQQAEPDARDIAAERELQAHIQQHVQAKNMKAMTTALTQHLVNTVSENIRTNGPGLTLPAAPIPLQQVHQTIGSLIGEASGQPQEQPSGN